MNHSSQAKARSEIALALLLWCVAAGLWMGRPIGHLPPEPTADELSPVPPFQITAIPAVVSRPIKGRSIRSVYGHSLVPGGIHNIDELMAVIEKDPRLAEHYRDFDLSKAHIARLDHDVVAYVSYRLAKGIYWEAKPSIIAKGEQVITDGTNFIRVRCGNLISYAPGLPTSPGEPEDIDIVVALKPFDPPIGPTSDVAIPEISGSPLAVPGGSLLPVAPPCCSGGGSPIPPPWSPPSNVSADEFSTICLTILGRPYRLPSEDLALLAGLLVIVAVHFAFRKWKIYTEFICKKYCERIQARGKKAD